jgi:hypothetical protein
VSGRTHLFVAPQTAPFGETLLGMRIADELHARGDEIAVFAHESLGILVKDRPFRFLPVPAEPGEIAQAIATVAADVNATSVVLLDATAVYMLLQREGTDATFLRTLNRRVIGLDVWNLRSTGLRWDLCGTSFQHSRYSLDVTRRLIPVPFARPAGAKGLYNALPEAPAVDPDEIAELRADLGAREGDRIVLITSARWQDPSSQTHETGRRLAMLFPTLLGHYLARLGPRVHVVHVSPVRHPYDAVLGDRYTWLPQRSPARFAKVLAAADVLLSFNFSATTIVSAIAAGVPVVLGINSLSGATADAVAGKLREPPPPAVRTWLEALAPVPAFRVFPLGLSKFLEPLARDNPYTSAIEIAEVLDEAAFTGALEKMLFDEDARAAQRERQAAYRAEVATLPKAADLVETYLG